MLKRSTFIFLVYFWFAHVVYAGIVVSVSQDVESLKKEMNCTECVDKNCTLDLECAKNVLLKKAFLQAFEEEVKAELGNRTDSQRIELLKNFIAPQIKQLIYGYRQIDLTEHKNEVVLKVDCVLDKHLVQKTLKKFGLLFTLDKKIPYNLILKSIDPEKLMVLNKLQVISGLYLDPQADLQLTISQENNLWQGELVWSKGRIVEESGSLEDLWTRIWSAYFSLPEVLDGLTKRLCLNTTSWIVVNDLYNFDKFLSRLDGVVIQKDLSQITLGPTSISAKWDIWVVNVLILKNKIKTFLDEHNITYFLKSCSGQ